MPDAVLRLTRQQAAAALAPLPALLAGTLPDPTGMVAPLRLRLGVMALSFIKADFVLKSQGLPGESTPAWKPLAASTIARRRQGRGAGTPQILRDTGRLLNSLSPGGPGSLLEPIPAGVRVGTNVAYAEFVAEDRPLWPEWEQWPERWRREILAELARGSQAIALDLLRRAAP